MLNQDSIVYRVSQSDRVNYFDHSDLWLDSLEDGLKDILPHGSGINHNWRFGYNKDYTKIYASNCFDAMNESGMYCHYYDFTLTFEYDPNTGYISLTDRVNFHGQKEHNCCGYDLKSYLMETIFESMRYDFESSGEWLHYVMSVYYPKKRESSLEIRSVLKDIPVEIQTESEWSVWRVTYIDSVRFPSLTLKDLRDICNAANAVKNAM